jgi:hypothetical protein
MMEYDDVKHNNYLKKYKDQYKLSLAEDGIWVIMCRNGTVQPSSCLNPILVYASNTNRLPTGLKGLPGVRSTQLGVAHFPESLLPKIVSLLGVRKRRHLSPEQRAKVIKNLIPFEKGVRTPQDSKNTRDPE